MSWRVSTYNSQQVTDNSHVHLDVFRRCFHVPNTRHQSTVNRRVKRRRDAHEQKICTRVSHWRCGKMSFLHSTNYIDYAEFVALISFRFHANIDFLKSQAHNFHDEFFPGSKCPNVVRRLNLIQLTNLFNLPFLITFLFLLVIRSVFQSMDFLVVVETFPFFEDLSIFCDEMSELDSLTLHFSFRFSHSVFVFTAIFELFRLATLLSGRTLLLDSEIKRFKPILQGWKVFPRY